MIFEIAEGNSTQRAASLALVIMKELSGSLASEEEMEAESQAKEVHNLLLFLWAVKKSWTSKVGLTDPPDSELFDSRCQAILQKLSPRNNQSKSSTKKNSTNKSDRTEQSNKTSPSRSRSPSESRDREYQNRFPSRSRS
jgi:hypothetical protein